MNTKFFHPFSSKAFHNPFLPFRGHPHKNNTGVEQGGLKTGLTTSRPPAPKALEAYEIRRTLSIEQEFQMTTYTSAGAISKGGQGLVPDHSPPASISLPDLKRLIEDVQRLANGFKRDFDQGTIGTDYKNLLEELIVRRFFGQKGVDMDVSSLDFTQNSFSFDFELDFEGYLKSKGQAFYTDLHFELHLDFNEEIRHINVNYPKDQGLRRLGSNIVDTGRYIIGFLNATSLRIFDKATNLSTTIWGDPHVDLSDVPGKINGEFSDLKKSSIRTTFKLLDSTEVVITAPDNGLIESVDIFKGRHHVKGHGLDMNFPDLTDIQAVKRFLRDVPGTFGEIDNEVQHKVPLIDASDVVVAGGDGNDWYDETGRLVWGNG